MILPLPYSNNHVVALAGADISPAIRTDSDSDRVMDPDEQRDYADQGPPSDSDLDGETQILATLLKHIPEYNILQARSAWTCIFASLPAWMYFQDNQMFCVMVMMCISQRGWSIPGRSAESTRFGAGCRPNWQRRLVKTLGRSCVYPLSKASNGLWGSRMPSLKITWSLATTVEAS
jgi:hypothetical protein